MFIVLVQHHEKWVQFGEPVTTYEAAMKLTYETSLPWLITMVVSRESGVTL